MDDSMTMIKHTIYYIINNDSLILRHCRMMFSSAPSWRGSRIFASSNLSKLSKTLTTDVVKNDERWLDDDTLILLRHWMDGVPRPVMMELRRIHWLPSPFGTSIIWSVYGGNIRQTSDGYYNMDLKMTRPVVMKHQSRFYWTAEIQNIIVETTTTIRRATCYPNPILNRHEDTQPNHQSNHQRHHHQQQQTRIATSTPLYKVESIITSSTVPSCRISNPVVIPCYYRIELDPLPTWYLTPSSFVLYFFFLY